MKEAHPPKLWKREGYADLEPNILVNIFFRLPLVPLLAARRACTGWAEVINEPSFRKSHPALKALSSMDEDDVRLRRPKTFVMRVFEGSAMSSSRLFLLELYQRPGDLSFYYHVAPLCARFGGQDVRIAAAVDGLLLVEYSSNRVPFCVYNPLLQESVVLPPLSGACCGNGFGLDTKDGVYKVVVIMEKQWDWKMLTYDIGGDGSWRSPKMFPKAPVGVKGDGVYLHGRLLWLASCPKHSWPRIFNLNTEAFEYWRAPWAEDRKPDGICLLDGEMCAWMADSVGNCTYHFLRTWWPDRWKHSTRPLVEGCTPLCAWDGRDGDVLLQQRCIDGNFKLVLSERPSGAVYNIIVPEHHAPLIPFMPSLVSLKKNFTKREDDQQPSIE